MIEILNGRTHYFRKEEERKIKLLNQEKPGGDIGDTWSTHRMAASGMPKAWCHHRSEGQHVHCRFLIRKHKDIPCHIKIVETHENTLVLNRPTLALSRLVWFFLLNQKIGP